MKVSVIAIAVAAVPGAIADFWLSYMVRSAPGAPILAGGDSQGGVFHNNPDITCKNMRTMIYGNSGDVSGNHLGMRTVPGKKAQPPFYRDPLDVVEFNTGEGKPGHHTIYKDRGYGMYDVNGRKTGQCHLNRTNIFYWGCPDESDTIYIHGSSMFFCESEFKATFD